MNRDSLTSIINDILHLQDLTPSPTVNSRMSSLVEWVIAHPTIEDIDEDTIHRVRRVCADAESAMERYWASRIIAARNSRAELDAFPYITNYHELTERELSLVDVPISSAAALLVVGSGPLPLSAFELQRQTGAAVTQVDSSEEAVILAQQVTERLGYNQLCVHGAGATVTLTETYDLVLIAALAGTTHADKQAIITNLLPYLTPNARVILRSARGSRTLLYAPIEPVEFDGLHLLRHYHPSDHIINSVLVYSVDVSITKR